MSHTAKQTPLTKRQGPKVKTLGVATKASPGSAGGGNGTAPVPQPAPALDLVVRPKTAQMPEFGMVVLESRHGPGFAPSVLNQDFSEFLLVIAGQGQLEGGGRVFNLGPDSLVHIPASVRYRYQDLPAKLVTLYALQYRDKILPAGLRQKFASLGILHWSLRRGRFPLLRLFRSSCKELIYEQYQRREGWETVLRARLFDLVVRTLRFALRHAPPCQPSFERASDSVTRVVNYATRLESEFFLVATLDEAARATGLSRRQFSALFRTGTGQSWHRHLLKLRLAHARQLLAQTDKTIVAVAFESGFEDLSHFNHVFKQAVVSTPSAFRKDSAAIVKQARPH